MKYAVKTKSNEEFYYDSTTGRFYWTVTDETNLLVTTSIYLPEVIE